MTANQIIFKSGGKPIRMEELRSDKPFRSAVLLLHGASGAAPYWMDLVGPALAPKGIACYAVRYFDRTGTIRAEAASIFNLETIGAWLQTIRDAVTWIQQRVPECSLGVLGVSLGGFLAMAMAVEDPRISAVVEISGGIAPHWVPLAHPGMPPVLILHGESDSMVPVSQAVKLKDLLTSLGVPCSIRIVSGEGHWFSPTARGGLLKHISDFLMETLPPAA